VVSSEALRKSARLESALPGLKEFGLWLGC
jgi:hypothetical protein